MNPTARCLYNLSLALTVLALACAIAFISSDLTKGHRGFRAL
jgi:hypothetical protein